MPLLFFARIPEISGFFRTIQNVSRTQDMGYFTDMPAFLDLPSTVDPEERRKIDSFLGLLEVQEAGPRGGLRRGDALPPGLLAAQVPRLPRDREAAGQVDGSRGDRAPEVQEALAQEAREEGGKDKGQDGEEARRKGRGRRGGLLVMKHTQYVSKPREPGISARPGAPCRRPPKAPAVEALGPKAQNAQAACAVSGIDGRSGQAIGSSSRKAQFGMWATVCEFGK